ncbi:hypothetical protein BOTBODRAFT_36964 [Botryobasidium botryosum FD-172 SS1]|uniref:Uncharacterized protein n=1 Tax=Botryobasidium botryosum (strain FD-172 SS1) TaxID=930990 RepID=A0A067MCD4_BOTB1|nr:hypothetical protein BOTBODRAFT_36964 [Botryobasidium botryosum FD-172 SS1]
MRFSTLAAFALAAAASAPQVLAGIFITNPIGTSSCAANTPCNLAWKDDGIAPNLTAVGPCRIYVGIGGTTTQLKLQDITGSTAPAGIDVSKNSNLTFTIDPTIGANSNAYFIRMESIALKDATNPANPYLAFSAKFAVTGMTGTFNATEQALINGNTTTAATAPTTTVKPIAPAVTSAPVAPATKVAAVTTSAHSTTSGAAHPSSTATNGAAKLAGVGATAGFLAALVSLAL